MGSSNEIDTACQREQRKTMMTLADIIQEEINRMCVTADLAEFDTMYAHARQNLDKLAKMIYAYGFKVESEEV